MTLREVSRTENVTRLVNDRMEEIRIRRDGIVVVWNIVLATGEVVPATVAVAAEKFELIKARASFRAFVDEIRDETHARAVEAVRQGAR